MSTAWSRSAPYLLDGLAWGIDPAQTVSLLATRPEHAHLRGVQADLGNGCTLAEALERRGAPPELVQAARVGRALNTPTAVGLRTRTALRSQTDGRFLVLSGLALPLASLLVAQGVLLTTQTALKALPTAPAPLWIGGGVTVAFAVGLIILVAVALPAVGQIVRRVPGLGWIGRRHRAARLADMLALTLRADGDLIAAARSMDAPKTARALDAGEALPAALTREPVGRLISPFLHGVGADRWADALQDAAATLMAGATERAGAWGITLRVGGTVVAATLIGFWLIWIYGAIASVSGAMPS